MYLSLFAFTTLIRTVTHPLPLNYSKSCYKEPHWWFQSCHMYPILTHSSCSGQKNSPKLKSIMLHSCLHTFPDLTGHYHHLPSGYLTRTMPISPVLLSDTEGWFVCLLAFIYVDNVNSREQCTWKQGWVHKKSSPPIHLESHLRYSVVLYLGDIWGLSVCLLICCCFGSSFYSLHNFMPRSLLQLPT